MHRPSSTHNGLAICDHLVGTGIRTVLCPSSVDTSSAVHRGFSCCHRWRLRSRHGLVSTIGKYFTLGSSDPSITHRTDNYTYVEQLIRQAPWFGTGGGTYIPTSLHILDNQYLTTTIELGLVGVVAIAFYFVLPLATALVAKPNSRCRTANALWRFGWCGACGHNLLRNIRLALLSHVLVRGRSGPRTKRRLLAARRTVAQLLGGGSKAYLDQWFLNNTAR